MLGMVKEGAEEGGMVLVRKPSTLRSGKVRNGEHLNKGLEPEVDCHQRPSRSQFQATESVREELKGSGYPQDY